MNYFGNDFLTVKLVIEKEERKTRVLSSCLRERKSGTREGDSQEHLHVRDGLSPFIVQLSVRENAPTAIQRVGR